MDDWTYLNDESDVLLNWAKTNLQPHHYNKIKSSHNKLVWGTVLFIFACAAILCIIVYNAPFTKDSTANLLPKGATSSREASIDYDDNFYWTYDSKKYEAALEDYGFNPDDFEYGDKVIIYIDDDQNIIKVTKPKEDLTSDELKSNIALACAIILILIGPCIYIPIALTTFGKTWHSYRKWYKSKNPTMDTLYKILE